MKTKTKKCNWCKKRKKVEDMYHLGKMPPSTQDYWICESCNLELYIV